MSRSKPPPPGIYAPTVLFFSENEDFDVPAIKEHVLRLAQAGLTGIVVQGSTGEAQHLSHEERKLAITLTRETLDENGYENVVIIAGCGAPSARESKKLCADAKEAGADFVLVLTPSVWVKRMTRDAVLAFHRDVADHSPLPYLVYNYPSVTAGTNLESDVILELSDHPNIVGTKLSCGSIGKLHRLTSAKPSSEFATFAGTTDVLLQGLLSGSAGAIAALPNIVPKLHMNLYELYQEGKLDQAMSLQAQLGQGDYATSKLGSISAIKALISQNFGYGKEYVRAPLRIVTAEQLHGPYYDKLVELMTLEKGTAQTNYI
ncbi:aldolase [Pisolithus thermaeus]|nr:aldolase [Pisolithus thermaeus]